MRRGGVGNERGVRNEREIEERVERGEYRGEVEKDREERGQDMMA